MAALLSRFVLLMLLCAVPLTAADIQGQVRTAERVVERATVALLRQQFLVEERVVGMDGRFEFHDLPTGNYQLRIRAEGYRIEEVSVDLMRPISREVVEIKLTVKTEQPLPERSVVSAYQLQIPDDARREYRKGVEERQAGHCDNAIPHFQRAIVAYKNYGEAHNELGNCRKEAGALREAEESFKKAIEYTPTIYPSMNLADLYGNEKRFTEGFEVLRKATEAYPYEGDPYFVWAKLHFDLNQMKEAVTAGLQAHQKVHRMADVHLLLAKAYLNLGDFSAVAQQLKLYLDENPKGPTADEVRRNLTAMGWKLSN